MLDWRQSRGQLQNSLARAVLGRTDTSDDSETLDLDRIVALAAGAIVMAHLNKVLAGNEISADQRIGIDAGIVILGNERTFTVRAEEFHDDVRGTARIYLIPAVARRAWKSKKFFEFVTGDFLQGNCCCSFGLHRV
jgi:hypothetical protein